MSFDGIRHTASFPCFICGGYQEMRKGKRKRCYGITSRDNQWCVCTREEYRGSLTLNSGTSGYHHLLHGRCHCGIAHGESATYKPFLPQIRSIKDGDTVELALCIWRKTFSAESTLVESYLRCRAITIPTPSSLRFCPNLWHTEARKELPAMVGKVTRWPGEDVAAIHRTYLKVDGSGKAEVMTSKKSLGSVKGGAVRLSKPGPTLALSEGIETGLSVQQETGLPVWVALSSSNLANTLLPDLPLAQEIIICADPDAAGQKAAYFAAEKWTLEGRVVRIAMPPDNRDFNDLLRQKGIAG